MKPSFEYRWGFAIIGGPICASLIVSMLPEAKPAFWLMVVMCSVLGYMFGRFYMDRDTAYPEESAIKNVKGSVPFLLYGEMRKGY